MNCEQVRPVIMDYLLEEVSSSQRNAVRLHLERCEDCSREAGQLRQTLGLLVQAGTMEEIPERIRIAAEPARRDWRAALLAFWRSPARLSFAAAGLACLAVGILALGQASVTVGWGGFHVNFAGPAQTAAIQPMNQPPDTTEATTPVIAAAALTRDEVLLLISQAVAESEARQQAAAALLVRLASEEADERRARDLREMAESLRPLHAAQVTMWKQQVQSQQYVSALMQRVGLEAQ